MSQNQKQDREQARKRATVIMKVRSGQITAVEGARELGVSRKTYYEWEQKALSAMVEAMENGQEGRPAAPPVDTEKEDLKKQVETLKKDLYLAEQTVEVKDLLHAYHQSRDKKDKKKKK